MAAQWNDTLALDSEFIRTDTFFPKPGLYQVASGGIIYLLDPLAITAWEPFVAKLQDPAVLKIMHACQEDLELIHHHLECGIVNLVDTQLINAFVTMDYSLSYARLLNNLLNVELSKEETRSNWRARPLSEEQIRYAMDDVLYLQQVCEILLDSLDKLGRRPWFEHEMRTRSVYSLGAPEQHYLNVKKAWHLSPEELSILQKLCAWRETEAQVKNVPRNRVVRDDALYELAQVENLDKQLLAEHLPPNVINKYGEDLMLVHGTGAGAEILPTLPRPLTNHQGTVVKELRQIVVQEAEKLDMSTELLGRKKDLELCVRTFVENQQMSEHYQGWRQALVSDKLMAMLKSQLG